MFLGLVSLILLIPFFLGFLALTLFGAAVGLVIGLVAFLLGPTKLVRPGKSIETDESSIEGEYSVILRDREDD